MTVRDSDTLKSYFNLSKVITPANYVDLVDTIFAQSNSGENGDHTHDDRYLQLSIANVVSAVHTFNPSSYSSPFILGAYAQGQTVVGLKADQLNRNISVSGLGLSGGGILNSDRNISLVSSSNPGASASILASNVDGILSLLRINADVIGDRSGSNLTLSPTGDIILDPVGNDLYPLTNYDINLGLINKKFLTLHAAELWVETLVAADTLATIGGRVLIGPTTQLTSDIGTGDTTIYVKHNNLASGDRVYLEAGGYVEFMAITSAPGGSGPYSYSVIRNLDGTGPNPWYAGDAVFNTGTTGAGFIDLYSIRSVKSATQYGPTIVGNVRNSDTYNDWTEHWAIGNLNGLYGYGANTYGVGLGKYGASAEYLTVDSTNGIRMYSDGLLCTHLSGAQLTLGSVAYKYIVINDTTLQIKEAGTIRAELSANVLTLGNVSIGEYISISSTGVSLYCNAMERISLTGTGVFMIKDSSGAAVFTFDSLAGAEFTKPLTLATTGGIYQGSGTFGTPTTGLKIWNDSGVGRIAGYNTGVAQWYGSTDGKLYAGGGKVSIDATGIKFLDAASTTNRLYWYYSGDTVGYITGDYGGAGDAVMWQVAMKQTGDPWANVRATTLAKDYTGTSQSKIDLISSGDLYITATNTISIQGASSSYIILNSDGTFSIRGTVDLYNDSDFYTVPFTDVGNTTSGWSSPTVKIWYKKIGKLVWVWFAIAGTSNATTASFTLPYAAANPSNAPSPQAVGRGSDNGGAFAPMLIVMAAGGQTVILYKELNGSIGNAWTASGTKQCYGQFFYEAA